MAGAEDVEFAGAAAQASLVSSGELSARELVEMALRRVHACEPRLRACTTMLDDAMAQAEDADRRRSNGSTAPLLGVPVVVKDNVDVAGTVTSHGTSAVTKRARADCEAVARLRAAGAVVVAKTTLPELAAFTHFTSSRTFGTTRNPWDLERSPGGSSGGSAAPVAAGCVGAALASDGGGSIRVPAACCGLMGLKPERGRVPLSPHHEHWYGLGVLGPLAHRASDLALMMDALTSPSEGDVSSRYRDAQRRAPARLRIAYSLRPAVPTAVSDDVAGAVTATAALLERLGHHVEEQDPDYGDVRAVAVPRYLRGIAADRALLDEPARLERRTESLIRLGRLISRRRLARARARAASLARNINTIFRRYDVLVTPVIARPAPRSDDWARRGAIANLTGGAPWIAFTQVWNVTGQPALSLPAGFDEDGMPLAVQLVGPPDAEPVLIGLAAQLEQARPWADRRPRLG